MSIMLDHDSENSSRTQLTANVMSWVAVSLFLRMIE